MNTYPLAHGATWYRPQPKRAGSRRLATGLASALALVAVLTVPTVDAGPEPLPGDALSLSMVNLLSDESAGTAISLTELSDDVLSGPQMAYGGDGTGIDVALIDSGVAPVDGLDGTNVLHGPDLSGEGRFAEVAYLDTYGHGTHMAGIIAGQRAGEPGVAPGARIVSLKVAGADGTTTVAQVVAAIDWVVDHHDTDGLNIRVLNLSLGQAGVSDHKGDVLSAAVERAWDAGIFVVVAAGNRGETQAHLDSPAIDPYVLAVGAVDSTTSFRSRHQDPTSWTARGDGDRNPDLAAPGRSIASYRVPGSTVDQLAPKARYGDDLFLGSGTSQSAAVMSGIAARLLEDNPSMTPTDLKRTLTRASRSTAGKVVVGAGAIHGGIAWRNPRTGTQDHDKAAGPGTGIVAPTGSTWSGGGWSGSTWSGSTWSGSTWSGSTWSGSTWSGSTWSGSTWSGSTWSGSTWSGNGWT
ncbi:MAG: S8 family serine peptidase [Actinomycetia bacterium]|nr:S8 family serine peptidase [Actinomycetes bacterium]